MARPAVGDPPVEALPAPLRHSPQVAVVLVVRDEAATVADAVDGVLAQAGVDLELLVVDDGSTDATPARLAEGVARGGGRLRALRQAPLGAAAARNAGIALTRAPLLLFLAAGDRLPAGYLARFLAAAAATPEAEVFYCGWREVDGAGRVVTEQESPLPLDDDPRQALLAHGAPPLGATVIRRAALTRAGQFPERRPDRRNPDLWLRLAASGATFRAVPGAMLTTAPRTRGR